MNQPVTKNALATVGMDALDRDRVGQVQVSHLAGGVSFSSALEVMEFAKLLSTAGTAIPRYLRANPGGCLAVTFQAIEWRFSPLAVANKSFEVNDRIGYESQLIHAVIESRAPLQERLRCDYEGEGPDRVCIVTGVFQDGTEREYRSPKFKDIRTKNSPLWKDDPDQQHWYYSSRSWCRKWCPDVILGVYSRDELQSNPVIGREEEPTGPTLSERLGKADRREGHNATKAATEIDNVAAGSKVEILPAKDDDNPRRRRFTGKTKRKAAAEAKEQPETTQEPPQQQAAAETAQRGSFRGPPLDVGGIEGDKPLTPRVPPGDNPGPPKHPTTAGEYIVYAGRWIDNETDPDNAHARWDGEDQMRNDLMVSVRARITLRNKIKEKFESED